MHIAAVSRGNSAEVGAVIAVVDENIIRLDICVNFCIRKQFDGMRSYIH